MKKVITLCLILALTFSLAACGAPDEEPLEQPTEGTDATASDTIDVCIISNGGIDDGSFNQNCYEGIIAVTDVKDNWTATDIKEPSIAELIPTVERTMGDYDVFVLPGFQFSPTGDLAAANPERKFILVDSTMTDAEGNAVQLDNVYTMTFREEQAGFFAGMAAALSTKTNKVAVVTGMPFPSNVNYQFGFMSGVNYTNAHHGTNVECIELPSYAGVDMTGANIGGNYVGDFADEPNGKLLAENLIAEGVDILYVAAGASGNGVFTAAKEANDVFVIGCDIDQFDDGASGGKNVVLTSTIKNMALSVERQLLAIDAGTFKGEDAILGADSDAMNYVSETGRHQLTDDVIVALDAAKELLKTEAITPASNFNGFTPTDFPGLS